MNKTKIFLAIGIITLIGTASAFLLSDRILPQNMPTPDSRLITNIPEIGTEADFNITNYTNILSDGELNFIYFKIFVPEDIGNQWNLSNEFAESKPYFLLKPVDVSGIIRVVPVTQRGFNYAYVCCNISKGDRLYTADTNVTNGSSLRGTLTNLYNINYKSRFTYDNGTFRNTFVGASTNPAVYNRRGALHIDGTQIAWAMETRNVTNASVPELMKVFLI